MTYPSRMEAVSLMDALGLGLYALAAAVTAGVVELAFFRQKMLRNPWSAPTDNKLKERFPDFNFWLTSQFLRAAGGFGVVFLQAAAGQISTVVAALTIGGGAAFITGGLGRMKDTGTEDPGPIPRVGQTRVDSIDGTDTMGGDGEHSS